MNARIFGLFTVMVASLLVTACGDECSSYSDFSCKEIQKAPYNAYFYFPDDREYYLGEANGLDECGSMAYRYADSKNLSGNREWSYICCMIAKGSDCYEKHR